MIHNILPIFLETVDSTNLYAKKHIDTFDPNSLTVISTSYQTCGLGTKQRSWHSLANEDLLASFIFSYRVTPYLFQYTQIMSIALVQFLHFYALQAKIKWPNDVLIQNRKIAGILSHPIADKSMMILGVGVNINKRDVTMIDQPATSIFLELKQQISIKSALDQLSHIFLEKLNRYHEKGFEALRSEYEKALAYLHQPITWGSFNGTVKGVSKEGYLIMEDAAQQIHYITSSSLQKLALKDPESLQDGDSL